MLAGGLDRPECAAQSFPHRIERRFARAVALIDRADAATDPKKMRSKLRRVARLLNKTARGIERLHENVAPDCAVASSTMLAEGARRAFELAMAP